MFKNLLLLLIAIASVSLVGCKKDDDVPCGNYKYNDIPSDRDPFLYQTGTYWVYQEISTGDIDSVWLRANYLDTLQILTGFGSGCDKSFKVETTHVMELESSRWGFMNSLLVHDQSVDWTDVTNMTGLSYWLSTPGIPLYFDERDGLSRDLNGGIQSSSPSTKFIELIPNLQIGGNSYTNIAHFRSDAVEFEFMAEATAYDWYWKGEGIVRRDVRDEQDNIIESWELIRWNIVR